VGIMNSVTPEVAVQLAAVCQWWRAFAKPYAGLIGFALTRPRTSGSALPLRVWQDIWEQCAMAVHTHAIGVDAWARSIILERPLRCEKHCSCRQRKPRIAKDDIVDPKGIIDLLQTVCDFVHVGARSPCTMSPH